MLSTTLSPFLFCLLRWGLTVPYSPRLKIRCVPNINFSDAAGRPRAIQTVMWWLKFMLAACHSIREETLPSMRRTPLPTLKHRCNIKLMMLNCEAAAKTDEPSAKASHQYKHKKIQTFLYTSIFRVLNSRSLSYGPRMQSIHVLWDQVRNKELHLSRHFYYNRLEKAKNRALSHGDDSYFANCVNEAHRR